MKEFAAAVDKKGRMLIPAPIRAPFMKGVSITYDESIGVMEVKPKAELIQFADVFIDCDPKELVDVAWRYNIAFYPIAEGVIRCAGNSTKLEEFIDKIADKIGKR